MVVAAILTDYTKALEIIKEDSNPERLYELRLDCDENLLSIIKTRIISPSRIILTVRSLGEGGNISDLNLRKRLILEAMQMQVGYLDLELKSDLGLIEEILLNPNLLNSQKLIISQHNYSEGSKAKYKEFSEFCRNIIGEESELEDKIILKYVFKPANTHEIYELLNSAPVSPKQIVLGIGKNSDIARTLHAQLNQEFVFGSVDKSDIPLYSLLERLIHPDRLMLGLVGLHLEHSLSPKIHNIFLHYTEQIGYYHLLEASNAQQANELITGLSEYDFTGFNVTFPYKTTVLDILDNISNEAMKVNAVNTIKLVNGKLNGFNTDITGFSNFLKEHNLHKFDSALVLGAGGASRAITHALLQENINVQVITRGSVKREHFALLNSREISLTKRSSITKPLRADIYINATPLGLNGEDPREFVDLPKDTKVVIDLLYETNDTKFIREIKKQGIEAYDGKEMLFNQALDAYKIWTGKKMEREALYNQFLNQVQNN